MPSARPGLRGQAADHRHLLTGSAALVVTAGITAVSGALFWLLAARADEQSDVGDATALFTSVLFVAFVGGLGQTVAAARYASGRDIADHVLFAWGALAVSVASILLGIAFAVLVDPTAMGQITDWLGAPGVVVFALLAAGCALALLVDVRLMTQRRWGLVVARAAAVGFIRFPLLAVAPDANRAAWLFIIATLPTAASGLLGLALLPRVTGGRHRLGPRPASAPAWRRYSLVNWASTLAYQGPTFAMPVIVLVNVDADLNASFYIAWGVASLACFVPMAIGQALLSEGGRDDAQLQHQVRLALVLTCSLMVVGTVLVWVGRDLVVALYGDDYQQAADILPRLVAAAIPWAVTSVYLTEARVLHRTVSTVAITVTLSVAILVPALLLVPTDGIEGAATAFLGGNVVAAIVAFVAHRRHGPGSVDDDVLPMHEGGIDAVDTTNLGLA